MATYATLTVPVQDIIGSEFNASRASVWIEPNVPFVLADSIRVGGRREQVVNGVATFANLVTTNSADNPASFGYRVTITAPPKGAASRKDIVNLATAVFPFTATANLKAIPEAWDDIVLPVEWRSEFRDEMEALESATAAHRTAVENVVITDLGTTDGQTKTLIETGGTLTRGALDDVYVTQGAIVVNVKDYGAACDDTADDTAEIQAAVDAAPAGSTILIPGMSRISASINVSKALTIQGASRSSGVRQVTAGTRGFYVTASGVTLRQLTIRAAAMPAAHANNANGIYAAGTYLAPVDGLTIEDCAFYYWARSAIEGNHLTDVTVRNNRIRDCWYAGVLLLSAIRGVVSQNHILNIFGTTGGSNTAYGIALSRLNADDLVTSPPSSDITVSGNVIDGVPEWEGLDTHGGRRIAFVGNTIRNCYRGVMIGGADNAANVETFGSYDCTVIGNTIDSGVTDGTMSAGIHIIGAGAAGAIVDYTQGTIISGNVVRGYGLQETSTLGGIVLSGTRDTVCSGNTIIEPSPYGIVIFYDNQNFSVTGNVVVDAWSTDFTIPGAIATRAQNNTGFIGGGNRVISATKTATYKNLRGVYVTSAASVAIELGENDMTGATTALHDTGALSSTRMRASKLAFFASAPVAKVSPYTQTYAVNTRTHAAYTADVESTAYTGAADGEAKLTDLNALRVAYENLRASHENTRQVLNAVIDDLQSYGLL